MIFLAFCRVSKGMEPLSFDWPAEIDVVRMFPTMCVCVHVCVCVCVCLYFIHKRIYIGSLYFYVSG